jgi:small subunit ribosomal protein S20
LANIKSQIKRNRQNEKRRLRNRNFRGAARTAVKDARTALGTDNSQASVLTAISALDRAAQKGAIHQRSASRRKSRLAKQLAKAGTKPAATKTAAKAPAKKAAAKKAAPAKKSSK